MAKGKGPQFLRFCIPIIEVLKETGGSGTPSEVTDAVIERLNIPEEEQLITLKNGGSRVRNQVAWAKFYLLNIFGQLSLLPQHVSVVWRRVPAREAAA